MNEHIEQNFFTGAGEVPLTATVREAELLFSASDDVKALAGSGELKSLHDRCNSLNEASQSQYVTTMDRLNSVVNAIHAKEDEQYDTLMEEHKLAGIRKHHAFGDSVFDLLSFGKGQATVENLGHLEKALEKDPGNHSLIQCQKYLVALLGVKVDTLEQMVRL